MWHKKIVTFMIAASYFFLESLSISLTITSFTLSVRVLNCHDFLMLLIQLQFNYCLYKCVRFKMGWQWCQWYPSQDSVQQFHMNMFFRIKPLIFLAVLFNLCNWYLRISKSILFRVFLSNPSCRRWSTVFWWVHTKRCQ